MNFIIEVNNISKKFCISHQSRERYSTLRDDMVNAIKKSVRWLYGKGETKEDIWALKNVNFSVEKGEILGLIGPNGAGKSTLLKVLTRITPPSDGRAIIRGSVGSLLEVGTGFHPELTGRENIYLNGAILGMTKKEITRKFDEIVNFASVEKFLDTPLKRYSSGMNVRLAFSVAAHLEPDILLVDEVLAVGDVSFQRKSLGKMEEITKAGDKTIIFISHNMGAIQQLCRKCILLDGGEIKMIGRTDEVVRKYLDGNTNGLDKPFLMTEERRTQTTGDMRFTKVIILDEQGKEIKNVYSGQNIKIFMHYATRDGNSLKNVRVNLNIDNPYGERITSFYSHVASSEFESIPPKGHFIINIPNFPLVPGVYSFTCHVIVDSYMYADWVGNAGHLKVTDDKFFPSGYPIPEGQATFYVKHSWAVEGD